MFLSNDIEKGIDLVKPTSPEALEYSNLTGDSSFLYILLCSDELMEYTGARLLALGSILGVRKYGRC